MLKNSVVIGSFNIRKLGKVKNKSKGSWKLLEMICRQFDLIAIQEIQDTLDGIVHLKERLGNDYGMAASDITGGSPGDRSPKERLAFLYKWKTVERTEIASDISYDKSIVAKTLFEHRDEFHQAFVNHAQLLKDLDVENAERKRQRKKKKPTPPIRLPHFLTFIRQPHCASFRISGKRNYNPIEFLGVNAHLLYGNNKLERRMEFMALIGWLVDRAKQAKRMYHPNIIMMGDCNLDFQKEVDPERNRIDQFLKSLNKKMLNNKNSAKINFPFLDIHPEKIDMWRTNARSDQTYDQIAIISNDNRLPRHKANREAGTNQNGFDFRAFEFVNLFSEALHGKPFSKLTKSQTKALFKKFEHDFTDHMPIWIRLPKPGFEPV